MDLAAEEFEEVVGGEGEFFFGEVDVEGVFEGEGGWGFGVDGGGAVDCCVVINVSVGVASFFVGGLGVDDEF